MLFPTTLVNTRWVNLWWKADIADNIQSGECALGQAADDVALFLGNLLLIAGLLLGIFLVHVAVISAVEASWLAKVGYLLVRNGPRRRAIPR